MRPHELHLPQLPNPSPPSPPLFLITGPSSGFQWIFMDFLSLNKGPP